MKNLLFVTVGTSVLDAPRRMVQRDSARTTELDATAARVKEFLGSKGADQRGKADALFEPLSELHREFWRQAKIPMDDRQRCRETSAELLTTYSLLLKLAQEATGADVVVLLVPQTPEAELAGRILKALMESDPYRARCSPPEVRISSIPDIIEREAFESLPSILLRVVDDHRDSEGDRVIFNATAGFGVVLIVIGMLAMRYGFRVYYQNERMTSPVVIQNLHVSWDAPWILS